MNTAYIEALDIETVSLSAGAVMNLDDSILFAILNSSINEYIVSSSFKKIRGGMFFDCKELRKITLHNDILEIGDCAFYNCESLDSILIPEKTSKIGSLAFKNCLSLTNLYLKGNVENFSLDALQGCINLKDIWVPWSKGDRDESWNIIGATIHYRTLYDFNGNVIT